MYLRSDALNHIPFDGFHFWWIYVSSDQANVLRLAHIFVDWKIEQWGLIPILNYTTLNGCETKELLNLDLKLFTCYMTRFVTRLWMIHQDLKK